MVFSEDGGPSTVDQFLLLLRTPYLLSPITFSHKPRSRIKSGMTELGDWHNVTSCHSELVSESRRFFRVTRMLSLRERKTTQQSTSFFLLFQPPNCYHRPRLPKQKGESKRLSSCITSGRYLLSHAVAHILPSARDGLTAGFGMEPGVSRPGIFTQNICSLKST